MPTDSPPTDPWANLHMTHLVWDVDGSGPVLQAVCLWREVETSLAAERQQATAQQAEKDAEIATLKHDVAFKDSLIWTSRESELYKATVAAEKAQKQAEAEVASLTQQLAEEIRRSTSYFEAIEAQRLELARISMRWKPTP